MAQTINNPFSGNFFQDGTAFDGYKKQLKEQGMETDFYNEFGKGFTPGSPEPTPFEPRYLTFTNKTSKPGGLSLQQEVYSGTALTYNIEYSTDNGETWETYHVANASEEEEPVEVELNENESVMFRGNNTVLSTYNGVDVLGVKLFFVTSGADVEASGDITSLLNTIGGNVSFEGTMAEMFADCGDLIKAPALPTTKKLTDYCYAYMFQNCTSLTTAPELPATTLANYCYAYMFQNCTSLTTAPELPATTLAEGCYEGMFEGCTSLETAPVLDAPKIEKDSYKKMFENCENLNEVKAMFETEPEETVTTDNGGKSGGKGKSEVGQTGEEPEETVTYPYTEDWLKGVSQTGTFIMSASATWESDGTASTIPEGWTIQTATE